MRAKDNRNLMGREQRWIVLSNGCLHGIEHSELVVLRRTPNRSMCRSSVSVVSISRAVGLVAGLAVVVLGIPLLGGWQMPPTQRGGAASTFMSRPGQTNAVTLTQSDNPKEASRQTVQSEQTIEYLLPGAGPGTTDYGRLIADQRPPTTDHRLWDHRATDGAVP